MHLGIDARGRLKEVAAERSTAVIPAHREPGGRPATRVHDLGQRRYGAGQDAGA